MYSKNTFEPAVSESLFSSNSSMSSSIGSSASQGTSKRRHAIEKDQNAQISHFSIRMAGLYLILLHDDILVQSSKVKSYEPPLNKQSVKKLSDKSQDFFRLVTAYIATCNTSDLTKIGKIIQSNCDINHLRIMLAPIIVDGEERRTVKGDRTSKLFIYWIFYWIFTNDNLVFPFFLELSVSISRADIHEVLNSVSIPILEFIRNEATHVIPERPEICINMEKTFYVMKSTSGKLFTAPRLNIGINLGTARFEFDISIFDRLNAHFTTPFVSYYPNATPVEQFFVNELSPNSKKIVESKSEIKINSDCLSLVLRFPIVDLRPIHDPDRAPWWQRNVRPDYLELKFQQFRMHYLSPSIYDVLANEINIYYHESFVSPSLHIGKASIYENSSNKYYPAPPEYPRILIEIPTKTQLRELNEGFIHNQNHPKSGDDTDSDPASEESIKFKINRDKESTPFSAKKVCRESDTPHSNDNDEEPETETLLIPGETEEMNKFCDEAMKFSKVQIKVYLPVISVQLKSKHLYEVIYNRIITDFLMWESSVPKMSPPSQSLYRSCDPSQFLSNAGMMDSIYAPFAMCKSNINFESSSSATNSGSESDTDAFFHSTTEKSQRVRQRSVHSLYQNDLTNATSFQLHVGQGMVSMLAPVRDGQNHVIPGQQGEFVLKVNSTNIFSVSGFHGNSNLGYLCIQGKNFEMYHCGQLPVPMYNSPLRDINCSLPEWLKSTIYLTPKSLSLNENRGNPKREMIALAIQIRTSPDQGVKRVRLSLGVQNASLKHNSTLPEHSLLTQIMDMFDIKDYPVPGFYPNTVLTELHIHLWDISIDYRPIHFPFRAVATLGSIMLSSNLASGTAGCTLRFVAEENTLSLAPQAVGKERQEENKITVLPSNELICIADLGLFEISLLLQEKVTLTSPRFDLRSSIKDLHLRTCSDSGKAFLEFIGYLAAKGDLEVQETDDFDDKSQSSSILQMQDEQLLIMNESTKSVLEVTQTQQEHVNNLMAEAMEESIFIPPTMCHDSSGDSEEVIELGSDVFFFPDEQTKKGLDALSAPSKKPARQKRRCASEDSTSIDSSSYREDEEMFVRRYEQREDSMSVSAEMRELLDFETSVMGSLKNPVAEEPAFEPLPQVEMDLGDITKYEKPTTSARKVPTRKISTDSEDDFCFIAGEEKPQYNSPGIPISADDPIRIVDNHFCAPVGKIDMLKPPPAFPMAVERYTLCDLTMVWHMYGGHDFPTDDDKKKEREERDEL